MDLKKRGILTVGMPIFNGEQHLESALHSFAAQSYQDYLLVISDNASTDSTPVICRRFAANDSRITYVRHDVNHGPCWNFTYLLGLATTPYFMWAACDDLWHPDYIVTCMDCLEADPGLAVASSVAVTFGDRLNSVPCNQLPALPASNCWQTRLNYLRQPEEQGKANIIYGIFRTSVLKSFSQRRLFDECWGADMILVYRCLTRGRLQVVDQPLFFKRQLPYLAPPKADQILTSAEHECVALGALRATWRRYSSYYWAYILVDASDPGSPISTRLKLMACSAALLWEKLWSSLQYLIGMAFRHRKDRAFELSSSLRHRLLRRR